MINVLVLAAGAPISERETAFYPPCLMDIDGKPLLERMLENCQGLESPQFLFALRGEDTRRFFLDRIVQLLTDGRSKVIYVDSETRGAACTALLGIEKIDSNSPLLILNTNELVRLDFAQVLSDFNRRDLDAGVVTFPSVHPRYSYVRLNEDNLVVEATEKRPISRNATAGFYWYRKGCDFVASAMRMIRKDATTDNLFYVCPVFNEMVLQGKRIGTHSIDGTQYMPLKTERWIERQEILRELSVRFDPQSQAYKS